MEKKKNIKNANDPKKLFKIAVFNSIDYEYQKSDKYAYVAGRMPLNRAITLMYLIK